MCSRFASAARSVEMTWIAVTTDAASSFARVRGSTGSGGVMGSGGMASWTDGIEVGNEGDKGVGGCCLLRISAAKAIACRPAAPTAGRCTSAGWRYCARWNPDALRDGPLEFRRRRMAQRWISDLKRGGVAAEAGACKVHPDDD